MLLCPWALVGFLYVFLALSFPCCPQGCVGGTCDQPLVSLLSLFRHCRVFSAQKVPSVLGSSTAPSLGRSLLLLLSASVFGECIDFYIFKVIELPLKVAFFNYQGRYKITMWCMLRKSSRGRVFCVLWFWLVSFPQFLTLKLWILKLNSFLCGSLVCQFLDLL